MFLVQTNYHLTAHRVKVVFKRNRLMTGKNDGVSGVVTKETKVNVTLTLFFVGLVHAINRY